MLWIYFDRQGVAKCKVNVGNKIRQGDEVPLSIYLEGTNDGTNNWKVYNVAYITPNATSLESATAAEDTGLVEETFSLGNPSEANFYFKNGETYKVYEATLPEEATSFGGNGGHIAIKITLGLDDDQQRMETISQYVEPTYGNKATNITDQEYAKLISLYDNYDPRIVKGYGANAGQQIGTPDTLDFTGKNPNATAIDPTLDGTLSAGGMGESSMSLGGNSVASGKRSLACGDTTVAKGAYSAAFGNSSVALGDGSFAEGAENVARGRASHAEGEANQALGPASHAEGSHTTASNSYSHASGYKTVTGRDNQFVCGAYNAGSEETIFEVGNGDDESSRKNAFAVLADGRAKVQAAPTEDDDVVRKRDIEEEFDNYQLKYSEATVRAYTSLELANADLANLAVGQKVVVTTKSLYAYPENELYEVATDVDGNKFLFASTIGRKGLTNYYVFKYDAGTTEVQDVHTGLNSRFTDPDGNKVNYGTEVVSDGNGFYAYVLDSSSNYIGKVSLGAKVFEFLDNQNVKFLEMDNSATYLRAPNASAWAEFSTGEAKIYGNTIYFGSEDAEKGSYSGTIDIGTSIHMTSGGAVINFNPAGNTTFSDGEVYFKSNIYSSGGLADFKGEVYVGQFLQVDGTGTSYIKSEGNAKAFYADGAKTEVSDPTGASSIELSASGIAMKGAASIENDPTEDTQIANKHYVDYAIATGGDFKLNIENGAGKGSLQTRDSAAKASGAYSCAFGDGVSTDVDYSMIVGYNFDMPAGSVFAVGCNYAYFQVGAENTHVNSSNFFVAGHSDFMAPVTFDLGVDVKGDLYVGGTLTATNFKAINATSLDTERATIGLAKGNTEPIESYIGLYAEKYNGTDYGALVWDNTGTAYVGDATVDKNGKISDLSHTLQPIMTRSETSLLSDGCVLSWDADSLKAVESPWFSVGTDGVSMVSDAFEVAVDNKTAWLGDKDRQHGIKVSSEGVYVEEPATDAEVANKKYVDDHSGSPIILRVW